MCSVVWSGVVATTWVSSGPFRGWDRIGGGFDEPAVSLGFTGPQTTQYPWRMSYAVRIEASEASLNTELSITRSLGCARNDRAPVLPGFHPYFVGKADEAKILLDGQWPIPGAIGSEPRFIALDGARKVLIWTSGKQVLMELNPAFLKEGIVVLWTDNPAEYFCVEPVIQDPHRFIHADGRYLERGETLGLAVSFTRIA